MSQTADPIDRDQGGRGTPGHPLQPLLAADQCLSAAI